MIPNPPAHYNKCQPSPISCLAAADLHQDVAPQLGPRRLKRKVSREDPMKGKKAKLKRKPCANPADDTAGVMLAAEGAEADKAAGAADAADAGLAADTDTGTVDASASKYKGHGIMKPVQSMPAVKEIEEPGELDLHGGIQRVRSINECFQWFGHFIFAYKREYGKERTIAFLQRMAVTLAGSTVSSAFSGIHAPGTSLEIIRQVLANLLRVKVPAPQHLFAIEWYNESQYELQLHPHKVPWLVLQQCNDTCVNDHFRCFWLQ